MFRLSHNCTHIAGLSALNCTAYSLLFIRARVPHTSPETGEARVASREERLPLPPRAPICLRSLFLLTWVSLEGRRKWINCLLSRSETRTGRGLPVAGLFKLINHLTATAFGNSLKQQLFIICLLRIHIWSFVGLVFQAAWSSLAFD